MKNEITDLMVIAQMAKTVGTAADAIKALAETTQRLDDRLSDLQFKFRELELEVNLIKRGVE